MNIESGIPTAIIANATTNTTNTSSSSPSSSAISPGCSVSLFPPLSNDINSFTDNLDDANSSEEQEGTLLWNNVNTFAIPGDEDDNDGMKIDSLSPTVPNLHYSLTPLLTTTPSTTGTNITTGGAMSQPTANSELDSAFKTEENESTAVFNISWGGDDKPPHQLHPTTIDDDFSTELMEEEKNDFSSIKLSRPLPKPRGIRKLPEPEPSADGTIDEDVLKRRKNTEAARKSRLKKLLKVEQLESKVNSLQAQNAKLVLNNAILESEKRSMKAKEADYQKRIKYLEEIVKSHGLWDS